MKRAGHSSTAVDESAGGGVSGDATVEPARSANVVHKRRAGKRALWLLGLLAPASALLPSQLVLWTGMPIFWWSGVMVFFVVIPVIDMLAGEDGDNPSDSDAEHMQEDRFYRWCTYLFLPVQFVTLLVACWMWAFGSLAVIDKIGLAVTVGLVAGTGINAAHELGHRIEEHERWLAKVALMQTLYGHFFVEHNRGHHVRVATPEDPASARFGENLYTFLPRSVVGGLRSAWRLENQRLHRRGIHRWSPQNALLHTWAMSVALFGTLVLVFGLSILPYLLLQAVVGVLLLETVNYVEHYGLLREKNERGRYERCSPRHSWNSDRLCTNIFLYHLQRHSDHHANPGKRYQTLRSCDEAPQLPAGYASMVLVAAVPPLWRRVMDRRVLAHYDGDITRANILPRRRDKVLARHGLLAAPESQNRTTRTAA
ncbi:alkane 1-monooxygenase [Rhodococcus sp. 14-2470-1a]|uniref:alkane 1-monooxygenase n=1 Tax=Rhodococcus sp. 14-2470-1a TaxID=2023150 RepID=UPI000B9B37CF|nr:alkane 1-monooxygenase [Rhodococcus sp. 14-2470-1a]OZF58283.1 alkane 1-monooxygenase [Rhodococcus sp. 14-2470-1a]